MAKIAVGPTETTPEFLALRNFVNSMREDYVRSAQGNKAAQKRLRKAHLMLTKFAKAERVKLLDASKTSND